MTLSDLLVSYKRVDAPRFTPSIPVIEQFPSYRTTTDREANTPSSVQTEPIVPPSTQTGQTTSYSITSVQVPGFKAKWTSPYTDRNKWVADLTQAYRRAGITNDNALKMLVAQDALESAWGRSAQGKFNFGNLTTGARWKGDYVTGNDKNAQGQAIKQKFRSYNSIDEYAADKLQFLKRLYDFDENDDINKFTAKLTGSNRGKRKYAEDTNYTNSLKGVYTKFENGGIIKYQQAGKIKSPSQTAQDNLSNKFPVNWKNSNWLHNYFKKNLGYNTSLSILSSILPESGADPHKKQLKGGPGRGLVQWGFGTDGYNHMKSYKMKGKVEKGVDPELQRQAEYIVNTVKDSQKTGEGLWHHGGAGSGYKSAEDARKRFISVRTPASQKARAFSLGYVRPKGGIKEATRRASFVASLDSVYNSKYK